MLNQLQRGDEPALLPCRRSGFLRRPYIGLEGNEEKTGAWLLGLDCGRLTSALTAAGLRSLWGDGEQREKLIDGMAFDGRGIRGARERAESLIDLFLEGFEDALA